MVSQKISGGWFGADPGIKYLYGTPSHTVALPAVMRVTSYERVDYKLCTTVHRCLQRKAPSYLADLCTAVSDIYGKPFSHLIHICRYL